MCTSLIPSDESETEISGRSSTPPDRCLSGEFFLDLFGGLGATKELRLRALSRDTPMTLDLTLLGGMYMEKAMRKMRKAEKMEESGSFSKDSSILRRRYFSNSRTPLYTALVTP